MKSKGKKTVKKAGKSGSKTQSSVPVVSKNSPIMPLGDKVVVKPKAAEPEQTASGIYIPDTVKKEKPEEGIVVAVGAGRYEDGKRVPLSVKVGDKVLFSKYGFDEVKIDGEEYFILKEENILGIIK